MKSFIALGQHQLLLAKFHFVINFGLVQHSQTRSGEVAGVTLPPHYFIGDQPILAHWGPDIQIASANKQSSSHHQRQAAMSGETQLQSMVETGSDRFTSRFVLHACSHPMEMQMAFLTLLEAAIFEPRIRD